MIRLFICLVVLSLISCTKQDKQKPISEIEDISCAEQAAVDYLMNNLVNKDSLFYTMGEEGEPLEITPLTLVEDSLFVDGLFFWKKLFATNVVSEPSRLSHSSLELEINGAGQKDVQRAKEFEKDFTKKTNMKKPSFQVKFPATISIVSEEIKNDRLENSLFIEAKQHLGTQDQYFVEISVYNLEYDEYKSILIYLDKECNIIDWMM